MVILKKSDNHFCQFQFCSGNIVDICVKTSIFSCPIFSIVVKRQHFKLNRNFDHKMFSGERQFYLANNCWHSEKCSGVNLIKLCCRNLLTLFCKLDRCINVDIIFLCCEMIELWKRVNLHQKSFMRLTPALFSNFEKTSPKGGTTCRRGNLLKLYS
jgi:hypothetical protein